MKNEVLGTAVRAARLAGKVILDNLGKLSKEDIHLKKAADFVTRVDNESEQIIIDTINERFPSHLFLAEESRQDIGTEQYRWIETLWEEIPSFMINY